MSCIRSLLQKSLLHGVEKSKKLFVFGLYCRKEFSARLAEKCLWGEGLYCLHKSPLDFFCMACHPAATQQNFEEGCTQPRSDPGNMPASKRICAKKIAPHVGHFQVLPYGGSVPGQSGREVCRGSRDVEGDVTVSPL